MEHIIVTNLIHTGNLVTDESIDANQSAENLADMEGALIYDFIQSHYPEIKFHIDIAIQEGSGPPYPLEVIILDADKTRNETQANQLREQLMPLLAEVKRASSWMVPK